MTKDLLTMPRQTLPWYLVAGKRLLKPCLLVVIALFVTGPFLMLRNDESYSTYGDEEEGLVKSDETVPKTLKSDVGQPPPVANQFEEIEHHDILLMKQTDNEPMGNPIVIWWTPFTGEIGSNRQCRTGSCFFTQVRAQ